ncbi:MAG TPA: GAP family protein [Gaiellaceae bacterium]|nr:GAP family protein [Gaiellaceae bacterium]
MGWIDTELVLVSLAAMLSPTTLTFSIFALVLSKRPLFTGIWFWLGAFIATISIGILAAFVLGDTLASKTPSQPKTWVAILDIVLAVLLLFYALTRMRKPLDPKTEAGMMAKMESVASARWIAVIAAGATLANPGGFIPIALKTISETKPSAAGYIVQWLFFTLASILPLGLAIIALVVRRSWATRVLGRVRDFLEKHVMQIAFVIVVLLAAALLRNGISGLTS